MPAPEQRPGEVIPTTPERDRLEDLIRATRACVGVIGLGYVGLPLSLTFAERGFRVLGFDTDPAKVEALRAGRSYIGHLDAARLDTALGAGRFEATADLGRLDQPDAILICVPTPLTASREPDLRFVEATVEAISRG